jgi:hypothetical protein
MCDDVDISRSNPAEGDDGRYEADQVEELKVSLVAENRITAVLEYALSSSAVRKVKNIRRRLGSYH